MNYIDVLFLIPICYVTYKGFKNGLIIEIFTLLALLLGIYAGIHFSDFTADKLKETFDIQSKYLPVIAFTVTFLAIGAMVYFAGKVLEKVVGIAQLSLLNKLAGAVFGLLKISYLLGVLVLLIESYDEKTDVMNEKTKENSLLFQPIKTLTSVTFPYFKESKLFLENQLSVTQLPSETMTQ